MLRAKRPWARLALAIGLSWGVAQAAPPVESHRTVVPVTAPIDDAAFEQLLQAHHRDSTSVRMVLLPTTVTDRRGRFIQGLGRDDFRLFENHRPQSIEVFSVESGDPVAIAFLLDLSGSMRAEGKLKSAKQAIRFFVDQLQADDSFALIGFADERVDWITDFTSDREDFFKRLQVQEGWGQTALHDAIVAAPKLVDDRLKGRRAIVLITDGVDNFSRITPEEAVKLARLVNVPVYTLGFLSAPEVQRADGSAPGSLEMLRHLSAETGGRLLTVDTPQEIGLAAIQVADELRHQYLIGYYTNRNSGGFRPIRLEVRDPRLAVRTRTGFVATP